MNINELEDNKLYFKFDKKTGYSDCKTGEEWKNAPMTLSLEDEPPVFIKAVDNPIKDNPEPNKDESAFIGACRSFDGHIPENLEAWSIEKKQEENQANQSILTGFVPGEIDPIIFPPDPPAEEIVTTPSEPDTVPQTNFEE